MWKTFEDDEDNASDGKLASSKLPAKRPLVLVMLTVTLEPTEEQSKYSKLFLTLHLVQQLLLRGYRVRVAISSSTASNTVSNVSKIKETEMVFLQLSGAQGFIEVVNIEEDYSTLDYSFSGDVVCVFLVSWKAVILEAATFEMSLEYKLIQRVEKVLYMCQNVNSVKKLVITSCIAALVENCDVSKVYSEADWNKTSTFGTDPHAFSKVTAEKRALEFASAPHCSFRVATILPGLLLGPHLVPGCETFGYRYLIRFINTQRGEAIRKRMNY
eukprot:gene24532-31949_t